MINYVFVFIYIIWINGGLLLMILIVCWNNFFLVFFFIFILNIFIECGLSSSVDILKDFDEVGSFFIFVLK